MAKSIFYIGDSGVGKSTALRTLKAEETFIISPNIKDLPFPGAEKLYTPFHKTGNPTGNSVSINDIKVVGEFILAISKTKPSIKNIVIEDLSHYYTHRTMDSSFITNDDWSKWTEFATDVYNAVISKLTLLRDDITVIIIQHTEMKDDGVIADKTVGKMLNKVKLPSWFTVVLHGRTMSIDGVTRYMCQTNINGSYLAKSPAGMFKDLYVRNDMAEILEAMSAYYKGESKNEVVFI